MIDLEGAECRLRLLAEGNVNRFDEEEAKAIADELDWLRTENERLRSEVSAAFRRGIQEGKHGPSAVDAANRAAEMERGR